MQMPIGEWLGWAMSLIDGLGLREVIIAGFVILLAVAVVHKLFGRGGE